MGTHAALKTYRAKRNFAVTAEPADGGVAGEAGVPSFVVQKHWASSLHYDFRLEIDGTMKSWAVPKGPSFDPRDKRLAVQVEDHPIAYSSFEGKIPEGQYGAGKVIVWDKGHWTPVGDPADGLRKGNLKFELHGHKLQGNWALVRMHGKGEKQPPWLLLKEKDGFARPATEFSVVDEMPDSVKRRKPPAVQQASEQVAQVPQAANKTGADDSAAHALSTRFKVTHAERVIDPSTGTTKLDLVRYYALVGDLMLAQLRNRPVALVRAPAGMGEPLFFQKHAEIDKLPGLRQLDPALDPGHAPLLAVASTRGLLSAAQWNVVEFHSMNAVAASFDKPDRLVFDLDPGEGVRWRQMQEAAELVHAFLDQLGMPAFLKTSGGKGLHVVVPIKRLHTWVNAKGFAQAIVQHLARTIPGRFVAKSGPRNRVGKIFVDYLRNGQGATTVCAWSARARPGMGISVPLGWDELAELKRSDQWNVRNVHERLDVGNAPWQGYARAARSLRPAMKALGFKEE
jgi:DNA ligase D-like protein (predicted polymerase)/DNA ligase D-like protein (predicted 3'-phosphoesterase)